jgi:hypothetical protein
VLRSLGVIGFIGIVGATAAYFATKPTVAQGHVLAADLTETNATVKAMTCDKDVPIGMTGAKFNCFTEFKNGDSIRYTFAIDRAGAITVVEQGQTQSAPVIKKTTDPWGD